MAGGGTYDAMYAAVSETLANISDADRDRVFSGTAMELYGLAGR